MVNFYLKVNYKLYFNFVLRLMFNVAVTYHLNGKLNHSYVRIWGKELPQENLEHVKDSPTFNVFRAI